MTDDDILARVLYRDALMLAACKSCHATTQAMQGNLTEKGLPSLQRLLYAIGGILPKSEEYIRSWVNYPSISHAAKKAFEPLLAAVGMVGLAAMGVFLLILVVGFVYEWKKGALEWD